MIRIFFLSLFISPFVLLCNDDQSHLDKPKHSTIYVYSLDTSILDPAASYIQKTKESLEKSTDLSVQIITQEKLFKKDWIENAHTIVFPGAPTSSYLKELSDTGIEILREAVLEEEIGFFGICGGAILGCKSNAYEVGPFKWTRNQGLLNLSQSHGRGPYQEVIQETILQIKVQHHQYPLVYYGGSYFENILSESEDVLGYYPDGKAAIIRSAQHIILCSVHPEIPILSSQVQEIKRKEFWNSLLKKLNIPLKNKNSPIPHQ